MNTDLWEAIILNWDILCGEGEQNIRLLMDRERWLTVKHSASNTHESHKMQYAYIYDK